MKKGTKIILGIIAIAFLGFVVDIICIFNFNKPLIILKTENIGTLNTIYRGIIYDTYNCAEYTIPQIKFKWVKYTCNVSKENKGEILEIVDTTKEIYNFTCAEALEQFYEDDNYKYFYSCIKSKYIIVKYENGYEETVKDALKHGNIKIADLDRYNISYIKYNK